MKSLLLLLVLAPCLLTSACGSTTDTTLPGEVSTSDSVAGDAAVDESSPGDSVADDSDSEDGTIETEPSDPSRSVPAQAFADMDEDVQRELLFGLVEEAHDAYFACVTDPQACDFESDFAHLTSGPYRAETERVYRWMVDEGLRARVPETDELYYVGFLAQDVTPFQAIVRVCFTDTGEIYRPADGGEAEIVNADAVASKVDYLVLEDPEGNLKVDDEERLERSEDLTLCDEYS
jgi:hypothetical protein